MKEFVITSVLAGTLIVPNVLGSVSADNIINSSSSVNSSAVSTPSSSSVNLSISSELPINQQAHIYANTYLDHRITFFGGV